MLNVTNLDILITTLKALPDARFTMVDWATKNGKTVATVDQLKHDCGTCGCLGGWTDTLFTPEGTEIVTLTGVNYIQQAAQRARIHLGLTDEQADHLFMPTDVSWADVSRLEAIKTLETLRDTGEVDWSHAASYRG